MTEKEWLESADPARMLDHCCGKTSDRKFFKIACAARWVSGNYSWGVECLWREWDADVDLTRMASGWNAARCARVFLDGSEPYCDRSMLAGPGIIRDIIGNPFRPATLCGLSRKPFHSQFAHVDSNDSFWLESECPACKPMLTPTVLSLAHAAYDERQTDGTLDPLRLSVLADALEEAGCADDDILFHLRGVVGCDRCEGAQIIYDPPESLNRLACPKCRGEGLIEAAPHWRGCWVVDLLLGKG